MRPRPWPSPARRSFASRASARSPRSTGPSSTITSQQRGLNVGFDGHGNRAHDGTAFGVAHGFPEGENRRRPPSRSVRRFTRDGARRDRERLLGGLALTRSLRRTRRRAATSDAREREIESPRSPRRQKILGVQRSASHRCDRRSHGDRALNAPESDACRLTGTWLTKSVAHARSALARPLRAKPRFELKSRFEERRTAGGCCRKLAPEDGSNLTFSVRAENRGLPARNRGSEDSTAEPTLGDSASSRSPRRVRQSEAIKNALCLVVSILRRESRVIWRSWRVNFRRVRVRCDALSRRGRLAVLSISQRCAPPKAVTARGAARDHQ